MRTQGAFYSDTAHLGGRIFYGPGQLSTSGTFTLTRNAAGDVSLNGTPSAATYFWLDIINQKRLIEPADPATGLPFQVRFGTSASTPGWPGSAAGFPPFGDMTQFTPASGAGAPPKGICITDIFAVYSATGALTAATLAMYRTAYTENTALAVTTVVTPTAISLAATSAANAPHVQTVAVAAPLFETVDSSDVFIELALTGGAVRIYGMGAHFQFNWD